jgi:hypothetical protein
MESFRDLANRCLGADEAAPSNLFGLLFELAWLHRTNDVTPHRADTMGLRRYRNKRARFSSSQRRARL